ncbi:MAG: glutamine synthetase [Cytophagales bacterium]|nr:glutamine synthetase [Cytophagales bacterium]
MTSKQIIKHLKDLEATKVKLAITDIDGILRGKVISLDKFEGIVDGSFGFCNVVFGWDSADVSYDNGTFSGWHTGYPDEAAYVDIDTLRTVPWDEDIPFFLADFSGKKVNKNSFHVCPRTLLKKVRKELENDFGFEAMFSQEFEWFNFAESPESLKEKQFVSPTPMTPGMFGYSILRSSQRSDFFNDLFDLLTEFNIPIEGIHTETGPGVYEAAITYATILESADRAVLFKSSVKEIASRHGIMASFIAKWSENLPGCSGHVHQSLWDGDKNLFYEEKDKNKMSSVFKSYIAGQLHCLPHILPMLAPNINSFKRLVEGAWAPTTLTWGIDNRTVALRALPGGAKSSRLENRVPGSDTNPYLVMAACLASGMYGIRNKLKLSQPAVEGNGYEVSEFGKLPTSLWEATQKMKESKITQSLFGKKFVQHFCETREWECREHAKAVSNWEIERYFEII